MKYLLDTHTLIWYFEDSPKLPVAVYGLIDDAAIEKFACSISLWEIAIKSSIGKMEMRFSFDYLLGLITSSDLTILHIADEHLKGIANLPQIHKDPFDRLLISTAQSERMTIITIDENIHKYDVLSMW